MAKMGMHNRITEKRYNKIKVEAKSPKDDEKLMKKYNVGKTTMTSIRNTDNFYEYRKKGTTGRTKRDHLQATLADLQEESRSEAEDETKRILVFSAIMLIFLALILGTVVLLLARDK